MATVPWGQWNQAAIRGPPTKGYIKETATVLKSRIAVDLPVSCSTFFFLKEQKWLGRTAACDPGTHVPN